MDKIIQNLSWYQGNSTAGGRTWSVKRLAEWKSRERIHGAVSWRICQLVIDVHPLAMCCRQGEDRHSTKHGK